MKILALELYIIVYNFIRERAQSIKIISGKCSIYALFTWTLCSSRELEERKPLRIIVISNFLHPVCHFVPKEAAEMKI